MIYFIRAVDPREGALDEQLFKIGYTSGDPKERLADLQTGCPYKLYLAWTIEGEKEDEKRWHRKYRDHRVRRNGEWFRLTSQMQADIDSASRMNIPSPPDIIEINPPIEMMLSLVLPPLPYDHVSDKIDPMKLHHQTGEIIYAAVRRQIERFRHEFNKRKGRLF